jgi:hypothetical protein
VGHRLTDAKLSCNACWAFDNYFDSTLKRFFDRLPQHSATPQVDATPSSTRDRTRQVAARQFVRDARMAGAIRRDQIRSQLVLCRWRALSPPELRCANAEPASGCFCADVAPRSAVLDASATHARLKAKPERHGAYARGAARR